MYITSNSDDYLEGFGEIIYVLCHSETFTSMRSADMLFKKISQNSQEKIMQWSPFLRILTGKKHRQIKLQRLQKV